MSQVRCACSRLAESSSLYCWQHKNYISSSQIKVKEKAPRILETEPEDWEPKTDEEYYGKIPKNFTYNELKIIMVNGLRKYRDDLILHGEEAPDRAHLEGMLDAWLEHDSVRENKFDYLVTDDNSEQFFADVMGYILDI